MHIHVASEVEEYLDTVGRRLSELVGTGGCSKTLDNQNSVKYIDLHSGYPC